MAASVASSSSTGERSPARNASTSEDASPCHGVSGTPRSSRVPGRSRTVATCRRVRAWTFRPRRRSTSRSTATATSVVGAMGAARARAGGKSVVVELAVGSPDAPARDAIEVPVTTLGSPSTTWPSIPGPGSASRSPTDHTSSSPSAASPSPARSTSATWAAIRAPTVDARCGDASSAPTTSVRSSRTRGASSTRWASARCSTCATTPSAHATRAASLRLEFGEIVAPALGLPSAKRVEIVPAENPGVVHVVEAEPDRVVAHRVDADDLDIALAGHGLALGRAMALDLGGRAGDAQVFGREREARAVVEGDRQRAPVLGQAQLRRPAGRRFRRRHRSLVLRAAVAASAI